MKKYYLQFILIGIFLVFLLSPITLVKAEANLILPDPQIEISGELTNKLTAPPECHPLKNGQTTCKNRWISDYIETIYKYLISIVGILATVIMMIGGVIWITAGGNASRIGEAKAWIGGALMGLVLALSSYTILYQINDETVKMKPITYTKIDSLVTGCCENKDKKQYLGITTQKECEKKDKATWAGKGTIWNKINKSCGFSWEEKCCEKTITTNSGKTYTLCKTIEVNEECSGKGDINHLWKEKKGVCNAEKMDINTKIGEGKCE